MRLRELLKIHPHCVEGASRHLEGASADRPRQGSRGRVCTWRAPGNGIAKKVEAHRACELASEIVEGCGVSIYKVQFGGGANYLLATHTRTAPVHADRRVTQITS